MTSRSDSDRKLMQVHISDTIRRIDALIRQLSDVRLNVRAIEDRQSEIMPKPKGKKKTFLKKKLEDATSAHYWEDPYTNFDDAVDYWKCNPGSILEIVVRKPVVK